MPLKLKINNNKFKNIWRLEAISHFPVDCFGLISGIVGYKKYRFSNLIYIWINTSFYSSIFSLYLYHINRMNLKDTILSFLPILTRRSWYITAYFSLYLFIPILNFGINNINRKTYRNLIIFYILFFSFYYIIGLILNLKKDFVFLNYGYSSHWLIILYIIGGYLGKYNIINTNNINLKYFIIYSLIYLFSAFISSELFFILIRINSSIINKHLLINYLSPTIVFEALSLLMMFSKLSFNKYLIKIISFFIPLNLNITLLHWRLFYEKFITFNWINKFGPNKICIVIYLFGLILYIFCGLIDYLRSILFKFLKIKQFCLFIEDKFSKIFC